MGAKVEEVEAQGAVPFTWLQEYVPPCKPKTKIPKDINERKNPLETPLLPNKISFDDPRLERVLLLKLED